MHLEKPKRLIIWNGAIICQIVMERLMKGESNLRRRDL